MSQAQPKEQSASQSATTELTDFLSGFQFVESDGSPYVALDNQRRFYLNATTRKLLGIKPFDRVAIAYDAVESTIAIVKHGVIPLDGPMATSNYVVDKRYYLSARHFSRFYGFNPDKAPYYFDYVRGSDKGSAFAFRIRKTKV